MLSKEFPRKRNIFIKNYFYEIWISAGKMWATEYNSVGKVWCINEGIRFCHGGL